MSRGPSRDQGSTWRNNITLARRPLSTAWARTCHHFLLILAHLLTHTTADVQESSHIPVPYREHPISKVNDIILSYPPAPSPPSSMMSGNSLSGALADDDLEQLFLEECLQDNRCSRQLVADEAATEEESAPGKRSSYLFRARRGGDSYLFRSRRGGQGYLFRSKKGGNYLFRSRRESEQQALPTYLGGGEANRVRKSLVDLIGARPGRGSYLFRTRKDEDHSSGSQEVASSIMPHDGPVSTRQTRSKYFFRTRKGESDDGAENELIRETRGGQKGYLFRTKKTPAGLVSRSYLFRT